MGFSTDNKYQQKNQNGFAFGTMLGVGGVTALAFYMNQKKQ